MAKIVSTIKDTLAGILNQKFLLLNILVSLLCFVLLPGLIISRGISSMQAIQTRIDTAERHKMLEERLDELEFFASNDRFAHFLLYSLCRNDDGRLHDIDALADRIRLLKSMYPGAFRFVVADAKGNILNHLSDEKGFAYLYRQAFALIADLESCHQKGQDASAIKNIDALMTRLIPLLGNVIRQDELILPLRNRRTGRSILASGGAEKFNLWYGCGNQFKIIVHVSRGFIKGEEGLKWASNQLNRIYPEISCGYSSFPPASETLYPAPGHALETSIIRALAGYENVGPVIEDDMGNISCRFLSQSLRGFSVFKDDKTFRKDLFRGRAIGNAGRLMFLALFAIFVFHRRSPVSLTVTIKVTAFFAYAAILPLLVIVSLSGRYLQQVELKVVEDAQKQAKKIIERLDEDYSLYLRIQAERLDDMLESRFNSDADILEKPAVLKALDEELHRLFQHNEIIIVDKEGRDFMQGFSPRFIMNRSLLRNTGRDATQILTADSYRSCTDLPLLAFNLASDMYTRRRRIEYLGVGDIDLGVFYKLLFPGRTDRSKMAFAAIFWKQSRLHENFILNHLGGKNMLSRSFKLAALSRESESVIYADHQSHELQRLMSMASRKQTAQYAMLDFAGEDFITVVVPGVSLNKLVLAAMIPAEIVNVARQKITRRIPFLAMVLLTMSGATIFLLRNWIFKPLEELRAGIDAIAARDFHKRLNVVCDNELGRLLSTFNKSLENLQELQIARIVQASILPEPEFKLNRLTVHAFSETMSTLGGDYFDIQQIDEERVLLFVGDATGHGVPAALSMAMARAVVINEQKQGLAVEKLMSQLNEVFSSLRAQGVKDFMTAVCAEFNSRTGEVLIMNFGHCYPLIIKGTGCVPEVQREVRGLPPGFARKNANKVFRLNLMPGQSLMLFTDGLIEFTDSAGAIAGFDGLLAIVKESYNDDPAVHLASIKARVKLVSPQLEDDRTVMIARFL